MNWDEYMGALDAPTYTCSGCHEPRGPGTAWHATDVEGIFCATSCIDVARAAQRQRPAQGGTE